MSRVWLNGVRFRRSTSGSEPRLSHPAAHTAARRARGPRLRALLPGHAPKGDVIAVTGGQATRNGPAIGPTPPGRQSLGKPI